MKLPDDSKASSILRASSTVRVNCLEPQELSVGRLAAGFVAGRLVVGRLVADPCGIEAAGLRGTEADLAGTGCA